MSNVELRVDFCIHTLKADNRRDASFVVIDGNVCC